MYGRSKFHVKLHGFKGYTFIYSVPYLQKIKATCNVVAFYVHVQTVLINNAEMNNISV